MNRNASCYFFIIILIISTTSNAQSTIQWSKTQKLTWADFKAIPNNKIFGDALTSYKIEIKPSEVVVDDNNNIKDYKSLTVVANFYAHHSWVNKKSDYLLTHEQLHFDIAGLYAQQMREEFKKLKKENIANFDAYFNVYHKLWAECRETQKTYDKETSHGQFVTENNSWIHKINEQLENR